MSLEIQNRLKGNLRKIQERIRAACSRAHREADSVTLVAVTKYAELDWVRELVNLGVTDFGEARPQQLVARAREFTVKTRWHLIGHLQRNKADDVLSTTHLIHSVDSLRLFDHLAKSGKGRKTPARVLLEVNISGESSKDGFSRDELVAAWPHIRECDSLDISGLMTMAPLSDESEAARVVFRQLRELRDELRSASNGQLPLSELSMGMSGDFEIAIEEGATIVRIGSGLFEGLTPTR